MPKTTKKITTIPATLTRFTATPITEQKKRRVAGYARVSTDHDDQFTSYEAQIDYYTNYIKSRDDWEYYAVYSFQEGCHRTYILPKLTRIPAHQTSYEHTDSSSDNLQTQAH